MKHLDKRITKTNIRVAALENAPAQPPQKNG